MLIGLALILVGIVAIILRKAIVKERAAFNKFNFGTKYSPSDFKYGEVIGIIVGILFIIFGLLIVLGIVQVKG